jgi:hypothetical protein
VEADEDDGRDDEGRYETHQAGSVGRCGEDLGWPASSGGVRVAGWGTRGDASTGKPGERLAIGTRGHDEEGQRGGAPAEIGIWRHCGAAPPARRVGPLEATLREGGRE